MGLFQVCLGEQLRRLPSRHRSLRRVPSRFARFEFLLGLGQRLLVDDFVGHHLSHAFEFRLPADDLRLVSSHVRLGFLLVGIRHVDLGLGQIHQLLGLLDHVVVEFDLGKLLLMFLLQFGNDDLAEHLALLHLVADVHVELLDEAGDLGENRCLLIGLDEAGLSHRESHVPQFGPNDADHRRAALAARCAGAASAVALVLRSL